MYRIQALHSGAFHQTGWPISGKILLIFMQFHANHLSILQTESRIFFLEANFLESNNDKLVGIMNLRFSKKSPTFKLPSPMMICTAYRLYVYYKLNVKKTAAEKITNYLM